MRLPKHGQNIAHTFFILNENIPKKVLARYKVVFILVAFIHNLKGQKQTSCQLMSVIVLDIMRELRVLLTFAVFLFFH